MKVLFLDVDGVLNNWSTKELTPDKYTGIEDTLVERLSKVVKELDLTIVLTSDWKSDWIEQKVDGKYLDEKLAKYGLKISERTYESYASRRGEGIRSYLSKNEVEAYVIVDDTPFSDFTDELEERFVMTEPIVGLTDEDVNKIKEIIKSA